MAIFRFIFSIIFAPIRWLANSLTQRKDNVLEWHLNYGPSFVKIETKYKEQFLPDDLLIAGYVLFLARYFFICDDRQIDIVRKFLLSEIGKSIKSNEITPKLYEVVFQTLNQMEKDATLGLFKIYNRFFDNVQEMNNNNNDCVLKNYLFTKNFALSEMEFITKEREHSTSIKILPISSLFKVTTTGLIRP